MNKAKHHLYILFFYSYFYRNQALQNIYQPAFTERDLPENILHACTEHLEQTFDAEHGGFGNAPKFPHPSNLERLLRYYAQNKINNEDKP